MSRIGKLPINIPAGVEISIDGNKVTVKGKEGVLTQEVNPSIKVNYDKEKAEITFTIDYCLNVMVAQVELRTPNGASRWLAGWG